MLKSLSFLSSVIAAAASVLGRTTAEPFTHLRGVYHQDITAGNQKGPGWGHAKVKRMAAKRRNVLRNKRAHRG